MNGISNWLGFSSTPETQEVDPKRYARFKVLMANKKKMTEAIVVLKTAIKTEIPATKKEECQHSIKKAHSVIEIIKEELITFGPAYQSKYAREH